MNNMYELYYMPLALQDMKDIAIYISHILHNPIAAEKITTQIVDAANMLLDFPYSNAVYVPIKPLKYEYRKLIVENYILFYTVDEKEKTITVSRIIYGRRDYENILK